VVEKDDFSMCHSSKVAQWKLEMSTDDKAGGLRFQTATPGVIRFSLPESASVDMSFPTRLQSKPAPNLRDEMPQKRIGAT
jgi:hypothetical protein